MILVVGAIGLAVNVVGLFLFHGNLSLTHSRHIDVQFIELNLSLDHGHSHGGGKSHGHSHGGGGHGHSHGHSHLQHGHSHIAQLASMDDNDNDAAFPRAAAVGSAGKSKKEAKPKSAQQLNMRGVFLHVLADALGSVVVIISALVIWLTDWEYRMYVDPALSVAMVCLIMWSTWPLCKFLRETSSSTLFFNTI